MVDPDDVRVLTPPGANVHADTVERSRRYLQMTGSRVETHQGPPRRRYHELYPAQPFTPHSCSVFETRGKSRGNFQLFLRVYPRVQDFKNTVLS